MNGGVTISQEDNSPGDKDNEIRRFYEEDYARGSCIPSIPRDDDYMYWQVIRQVRPYLQQGLHVLDLGCNDGSLSLYMAKSGCDVLGIDIARNSIDLAVRASAYHKVRGARFQAIDFLRDWDRAQEFDLVFCCHVLEHIPSDDLFLSKIYYSMKPKGTLLLLVPSSYSSLALLSRLCTGRFSYDEEVGHLRRYNRNTLISKVEEAGFTITRVVYLDSVLRDWIILFKPLTMLSRLLSLPYIRTLFNAFDYALARILFPAAICIHARRNA